MYLNIVQCHKYIFDCFAYTHNQAQIALLAALALATIKTGMRGKQLLTKHCREGQHSKTNHMRGLAVSVSKAIKNTSDSVQCLKGILVPGAHRSKNHTMVSLSEHELCINLCSRTQLGRNTQQHGQQHLLRTQSRTDEQMTIGKAAGHTRQERPALSHHGYHMAITCHHMAITLSHHGYHMAITCHHMAITLSHHGYHMAMTCHHMAMTCHHMAITLGYHMAIT
jgi:hypothetical protein